MRSPRLLAIAVLSGAVLCDPAAAVAAVPTCDGKTATIYRGSGHAGTDGAGGDPMKVTGTQNADVIVGDTGKDVLRGGGGGDTICGGDGADQIEDGTGADWVDGEGGNDLLVAGSGTDRMGGGDGNDGVSYQARTGNVSVNLLAATPHGVSGENDTIAGDVENARGGKGSDTLSGTAGRNVLMGGAGTDTIRGYDGNDRIYDGPDDDTVEGGNDNDTLVAGLGPDLLSGGAGTDVVTYAARTSGVTASLHQNLPAEDEIGADGGGILIPDVENLRGGAGNDTLFGNQYANVIHGEGGEDQIRGREGDDTFYDGPGNDTLFGDAAGSPVTPGDDLFVAGAGADSYDGEGGLDRVSYRARTQPVTVKAGVGLASGESSESDTINRSVEGVHGGSGADSLTGNDLDNTFWGGPGDAADVLGGADGNDVLYGEGGPDDLFDGDGIDALFGMAGDDELWLTHDAGNDSASCGAGNDSVNDTTGAIDLADGINADCETFVYDEPPAEEE